jgi:outer membrane receptor protein involved in Fe transport
MSQKVSLILSSIFLFSFLFLFSFTTFSQEVKGKVSDSNTGESMIDATVTLKNTTNSFSTRTGLDGSFLFKNIPEGTYTQVINFVGYDVQESRIEVKKGITINNKNILLKQHANQLNEVIVTSTNNRESDKFARKSERGANYIMNIISAKAIEISPDLTVGNVLQRAAGVSVVKNSSGDATHAIIRGMADRYNYVTVNGIKIPSPDDKTRSIPLDIFPSDLLEKLEVSKSLTPSMEGDAIGGVTNIVLKDAPKKLTYSFNVAGGYSNFFDNHSFTTFNRSGASFKTPTEVYGPGHNYTPADFNLSYLNYKTVSLPVNSYFNGSIGDKITQKLGFIAAVSYQHLYKGSSSLFYPPNGDPQPIPVANTPTFNVIQARTYSNLQNRTGAHLKLNYDLNEKNKISFYTAYFQLDLTEHRFEEEGLSVYLKIPGQDYNHDRSYFERQTIWTNSLQGKHQVTDKFSVDWSAVYSQAKSLVPIWEDFQYSNIVNYDANGKQTSDSRVIQDFPLNFTHSTETDHTGYLNAHYVINNEWKFSMGGLYRQKQKSNVFESYELYADNQPFTNINAASFSRMKRVDTADGLTYHATENILAYYMELKWEHNQWEALGGLRVENTNHNYFSEQSIYLAGKTGSYNYTDYLPSINLKYKLSENKDIRASYFSGISRPEFIEYIPVQKSGDYFDTKGNPNIQHIQSSNVDLRFEQYFDAEDYFMVGGFYKYLTNPIEWQIDTTNFALNVFEPKNVDHATNYGLELIFTKHFKNFAINGNYSYTKSSVTTAKELYYVDPVTGWTKKFVTQTRPLQGQSDHIANLSILYKSVKKGLEAQLSWVYTGKRIETVSNFYNLDYWTRATSQLDFSINYKVAKRVTLFGKATNLLNTPTILELHDNAGGYYYGKGNYPGQTNKNAITVQRDVYNQTFIIGIRFK